MGYYQYRGSGRSSRDGRRRRLLWLGVAGLLVAVVAVVWVRPAAAAWYWAATAPRSGSPGPVGPIPEPSVAP